ncbi:MAG: energy transducer TonB [Betaproteobacteria bacterium]
MIFDRPEEPGKKKALLLALAVHVGLIVFLFLGVQWKRNPPEIMEVELWSPTQKTATQAVPPPPTPPEPEKPAPKVEPKPEPKPPVKPDIVLKEEKKKPKAEPEPKKPEPKKPEPKPEVKAPPKPPIPSFENQLREEVLQRNAEAASREQRAGALKRGLADWIAKIQGKIRGNIVLPANIQGNPEAVFRVNLLPSGEVLQPIRLVKSSGNPGLDAAIERAILKSSPLPKPDDSSVFRRDLEIKYRPLEE